LAKETKMKILRTVALIGLGMVLATALFYGVNAVRAQGPDGMMGTWGGMGMGRNMQAMHGQMSADMSSMHDRMSQGDMAAMHDQMSQGDMAAMHDQMSQGDMGAMHAQMHDGEAMPTECLAMMDDPAMQQHMTDMMAGGEPMTPEEAQAWMEDAGIPADVQARCLAHMAEHHPVTESAE
jgi:hypothetical protein